MSKVTMLQPRVQSARLSSVQNLNVDLVSPRLRGRRWTALRRVVQRLRGSVCCDCGRLWVPDRDHVDHEVELADGGTNAPSNLVLRCVECHATKTKASLIARS